MEIIYFEDSMEVLTSLKSKDSKNGACGLQSSAYGLQSSACGLQNRTCGLQNSA